MDNIISDENLRDTFVYVDNVTVCGKNRGEHDARYTIADGAIKPDPERLRPLRELPLLMTCSHCASGDWDVHVLR